MSNDPFRTSYWYLLFWHLSMCWLVLVEYSTVPFKFPIHTYVCDTCAYLLVAHWMSNICFQISYPYLHLWPLCIIGSFQISYSYLCLWHLCISWLSIGCPTFFFEFPSSTYICITCAYISYLFLTEQSISTFLFVTIFVTLVHLLATYWMPNIFFWISYMYLYLWHLSICF